MSGRAATTADGEPELTYQKAIDIARNSEGELEPRLADYLEAALKDIWDRVSRLPDDYILTRDEFAIFNFFIRRFEGSPIAQRAIDRYWRHTGA